MDAGVGGEFFMAEGVEPLVIVAQGHEKLGAADQNLLLAAADGGAFDEATGGNVVTLDFVVDAAGKRVVHVNTAGQVRVFIEPAEALFVVEGQKRGGAARQVAECRFHSSL